MADDWDDNRSPSDEFNRYVEPSPGTLLSSPDEYLPPGPAQTGGTTVSSDFGERLNWTLANPLTNAITQGLMLPLDLPGGNTFQTDMRTCNGATLSVTQTVPVDLTVSPAAVDLSTQVDVYDQDPSAVFDPDDIEVSNSCAPGCAPVSPRLLAIVLYDPDKYQLGRATGNWTSVGCPTNNPCVTVSNIIGYFVHCVTGRPCVGGSFPPHGHFVKYPGMTVSTAPTFPDNGSWLVTTHLVR
jgi:hypothetical protein